jgi:phospholipid/cholesterol/gamma-HCH transport system permease protein
MAGVELRPGLSRGPRRNAPASAAFPSPARALDALRGGVISLGGMVHLTFTVSRRGVRRPIDWGPEFADQFAFTIRLCLVPLCLSSCVLAFGPMGVQASGFFGLFGSYDRMGSLFALIEVREFAPLVVGIIVAGAAGTAICADLGARVVREEVAALRVLGVDPVRSLVVPRALALTTGALLLNAAALVSGMIGMLFVLFLHDQPVAPTLVNFLANATPLELIASTLKAGLFGFVVAAVSCYNGLNVSGGAEGVGRAVNRSVVAAFLAIGFIDYVFVQTLLATNPDLSQVRG